MAERCEEKSFSAIGQELKLRADSLEDNPKRRIIFRNLIKRVIDVFPNKEDLKNFIQLADKYHFPGWAVECLPSLFVDCGLSGDGSIVILIWYPFKEYLDAIHDDFSTEWHLRNVLCSERVFEITLKPELVIWLERISHPFEEMRKNFPYASDRAMLGAITDKMASLEKQLIKEPNEESKTVSTNTNLMSTLLQVINNILSFIQPSKITNPYMDGQGVKEMRESLLKETKVGYVKAA